MKDLAAIEAALSVGHKIGRRRGHLLINGRHFLQPQNSLLGPGSLTICDPAHHFPALRTSSAAGPVLWNAALWMAISLNRDPENQICRQAASLALQAPKSFFA